MDIAAIKGKTVDDATLSALTEYVAGLTAKATTAQDALRAAKAEAATKSATLTGQLTAALERLGVTTPEELDALPPGAGLAEAQKQLQAKIKNLEAQGKTAAERAAALEADLRAERESTALSAALAGVDWQKPEIAKSLLKNGVTHDGDKVMYKTDKGTLIPLADAAKTLATENAYLVKPAGSQAQGSGWKGGSGEKPAPEKPNMLTATPKEIGAWLKSQRAAAGQ